MPIIIIVIIIARKGSKRHLAWIQMNNLTFNAAIVDLQVSLEVVVTRFGVAEVFV